MRGRRTLCVALLLAAVALSGAPAAQGAPGIVPGSFSAEAVNSDGTVDTVAGSHPYEFKASFELDHDAEDNAEGSARDITVDLPAGFLGNPTAMPRCERKDFDGEIADCPPDTQIGTFAAIIREHGSVLGPAGAVYNLVPPNGYAASFGFAGESFDVVENATLIPGGAGGYRVSVVTNNVSHEHLLHVAETVWGVPADQSHDGQRECILEGHVHVTPCSTEASPRPFLTMPRSCEPQLPTALAVDFTEAPGAFFEQSAESPTLVGCEALDFHPSISVEPETSAASSPTGLHVDVHLPQQEDAEGTAEADLRDATVTLPEGLVVNPSSANGLQACSSAQIGLGSTAPAACPAGSQIGTVEVDTPLIAHPLPGMVYLAAQGDNPFGSLLAIYVVVDDSPTGIVVKLAGHVEPDPATGTLTTTFTDNPQFPFEDFKLDFTGGPRAPLMTPGTCGSKTTAARFVPWTAPEHADVTSADSFLLSAGPGGSACAYSAASEPNQPGLEAGTTVPLAGSYSPFVLSFTRGDASQPIRQVEVTLPPGLTGRLAGVARCSDASIAAAAAAGHSGAQEQASPSCPASSELGTVDVAAGAGPDPVHVAGHAYLAGPYEGAPFSIAIVTPALAGPFDLGTVVVRSALFVDPTTAQVTVRSDSIPTILDGIPLDVRSIVVRIDRDQFTRNPTSCERLTLGALVISLFGQAAPLSNPFQVGGCAGLPFKPSFALSTDAGTSKVNGASLRVKVTQAPGEADIHKVQLQLPSQLPSRLSTIQKACTEAQFAAAPNAADCPAGSLVGSGKAVTPLLGAALEGPAYLVSHGGAAFPDVVFLLAGEGVRIQLVGHTDIKKGITYSIFEAVPDQPISSFEAALPEGPHSALGAFGNLCAQKLTAPTTLVAQSGAQLTQSTAVAVTGCPKPTIKLGRRRLADNAVLMAITLSQPSIVLFSGAGLRATRRSLKAGTHQIRIPLRSRRHMWTKLTVSARSIGGAVARTAAVHL